MKVAVDTNVLVRAIVGDDVLQANAATRLLKRADVIVVAVTSLCEFCWVLRRVYRFSTTDVAAAIRVLSSTGNVQMNRPAVEAGLKMLEQGGDFADGVIAYEGFWLGADSFASFDEEAVGLLKSDGLNATKL